MKKYVLILAAAVALAACAKTEVVPVNSDADMEITFQPAPVTRGTTTFVTGNVFQSAAFYDTEDFAYGSNTAETFIAPTTVKYFTSVWKAADADGNAVSYYWPKDGGKLSFFSWSFNKSTLYYSDEDKSTPNVEITSTNGVVLKQFMVMCNQDFMVAEPALNQNKNVSPKTYATEGVPTLFKHKLAKFIFKAVTKADYTVDPYNQKFTINKIYFKNITDYATYTQYVSSTSKDQWTDGNTSVTINYRSSDQVVNYNNGVAEEVVKNFVDLYIPQTYTNSTLCVDYTVSRGSKSTAYTEEVSLQTLLGKTECGKKYTITLNFGLDEILWDPAIEDWTDGTSSSYDVK